jgi:hypothetical protein
MLPLPSQTWAELERLHGATLIAQHFERLSPDNNFFANADEPYQPMPIELPRVDQVKRNDEFCRACQKGEIENINAFLASGADPNCQEAFGDTAL